MCKTKTKEKTEKTKNKNKETTKTQRITAYCVVQVFWWRKKDDTITLEYRYLFSIII